MENLKPQQQWDQGYVQTEFGTGLLSRPIADLIKKYFSGNVGRVFEIGCFPGTFLNVFGEMGHELNGIDGARRLPEMVSYLAKKDYRIGRFYNEDFLQLSSGDKFDIVCSFGFVEHFPEYETVIRRHLEFVNDSGYVMITVPNFLGWWQKFLHGLVDSENLSKHCLQSMDPDKWKRIFDDEGYEILFCGWFGKYDFWVEGQERSLANDLLKKVAIGLSIILKKIIFFDSRAFSPFCGVVAKKITNK